MRISKLEMDNKGKDSQIVEYKEKLESMTQEIQQLRKRVATLEDERKEFEMMINELKEENKKLKLNNLDVGKYEEWGVDEIIYWIISLDEKVFQQYEGTLRKFLSEEDVNGECLIDVEVSDIKRWGIKSFKHSKLLLKAIKSLVDKGKIQNNDNNMLNEGSNAPTAYIG